MPIIKSAIKRMRQTTKRRDRNVATKRALKAAVKAFTLKPTATSLSEAQSAVDTAVKKNLLTTNTAARRKASLSKQAKAAGVKLAVGSAKKTAAKAAPKKAAAPAKKPAVKKAPAKKK